MRKYMNNHFGQSRIFKHARFMADLGASDSGDLSMDSAGMIINGGGGGSTEQQNTEDNQDDNAPDIETLKAELAKAKADAQRFKNSNDKLLKEKGDLTKKNREMMTAEQLAQEAQEERDRKFAEMEKELRVNRYSKRLVGLGMAETDADEFASTMPEMEDSDAFFTTLAGFIKAREKSAADNAVQELLKSRPEINAGNGDSEKDDPAMAFAKRSVDQRKAGANTQFNDIINTYTH